MSSLGLRVIEDHRLIKHSTKLYILAISQAICDYRQQHQIDGPLFLGIDTHALSEPALASSLEVLAANEVIVMLSEGDEYTPDSRNISCHSYTQSW